MLIDFKEIPKANAPSDDTDSFEKFTREFFIANNFEIVLDPSRGPDGGLDLKIRENTENGYFTWLVSCKHYAHSQSSIGTTIEQDILDRVIANNCDGFIGFYSTIPSSSLINKLEGLKDFIGFKLYDNEKIERHILGIPNMEILFSRFFPASYQKWKEISGYYEPVKLLDYYLDNKQNDGQFLSKSLGGTNYLIKALRQYDNMEKALNSLNYSLITIEKDWFEFVTHEDMDEYFKKELPHIIEKKIGVKITPKHRTSMSFSSKDSRIYDFLIVYLNHIVASPEQIQKYNNAYKDLREMMGYSYDNC